MLSPRLNPVPQTQKPELIRSQDKAGMTARCKDRLSWEHRWLHETWPVDPPVVFTKGNGSLRAFENVNSSLMIFSETEDLISIYSNCISSGIKLLHLWQVDDQQFRCPLEQLASCFEIQIRIYC